TFHPSLPAYAEGCEAQLSGAQQSPANGAKMPFSMKDLALPEEILPLVEAGVNCLKIEGRMKSPLFVACATDYYRRILDGSLTLAERKRLEADLRTIFSRPWTKLFVRSPEQKGTVDPNFGGHRGTFIGYAQQVFQNRRGENVLRFHTQRALELHDGLQIEIPGNVRPYGFAIDVLVVHGKSGTAQKRVFVADAGSIVDVGLPDDAPPIPPNARVFCASSQAVKRAYSFARPKPGMYRTRVPLSVRLDISPGSVTARGCLAAGQDTAVAAEVRLDGEFPLAKDASTMFHAAREAFLRLGDTAFSLAEIAVENPRGCFVPISQLNQLRRELAEQCQAHLTEQRAQRQEALAVAAACSTDGTISAPPSGPVRWSIKVDDPDSLSLFSQAELDQLEEAIVDIELLDSAELIPRLAVLAKRLSPEKIRLSLPVISRSWEEPGLWVKINTLRQHGYKRWQGANLSALTVLSIGGASHLRDLSDVNLTFDWPLGIMNSSAA
ncbi:MAG TPA: DUF3656 domain-containing protein, partial [Oligoflexia bacterium]|nr:DUF3656 domain-containing protein [Oligoflexia bacterium]